MPESAARPLVSYVFPIYNEAGNLDLLYSTLSKLLDEHPEYEYEIVFVNDGSRDDSLAMLFRLEDQDSRVVVVDLSRNFGHQMAVTAGLDVAKGDAVIIMDSDMQDPPAVSFELLAKWREGYDVVYAQRRSRKDTAFKKLTANLYYRFLHVVTDIDIPRNTGDFRLVDRQVVDQIVRMREHSRFLRGMVSYVGFRQVAVPFDRDERHAGETGYPLRKMLKFAADGVMSFSTAPLRLISRVGYLFAAASFALMLWVFLARLIQPSTVVEGWTFLMIVVLLTSGVQMIMLGVVGSYVGRTYIETQRRPLYLVQNKSRRAVRP
ncbi:glycosyltransferase family 2 protein [Cellulosimicrobium cellulans]|uniref:glycosyltransferase family 2 protein n=1 Tax=Cellulosimicrobium cellulans TaxID=1710 RepID=UPI0008492906|nr:glycosyltransferase family 2 protein [Cellulosimicrobium cellulans]